MSTSAPDPPDKSDSVFDDFLIIRALRRVSLLPSSKQKNPLHHSFEMKQKSSDPKSSAHQNELDELTLEAVSGGAGVNLTGTDQDDSLTGTSAADVLAGEAGNDDINAGAGADTIDGGDGDDTILGGKGADTILGGDGDDFIGGGTGHDTIDGGDGNDVIKGSWGEDHIRGGHGDDVIDGGEHDDTIDAGSGNDTVKGGSGDDFIKGNAGHDTILGGSGDDHITGAWGRDVISGGDGDDLLDGGFNRDTIDGGAGNDTIIIRPGDGQDTINGGADRDTLWLQEVSIADAGNWTLRTSDGATQPLTHFMAGQSADLSAIGGEGELISPDGKVTTFSEMETLQLDTPTVQSGDIAPLQVIPPHVEGTPVATIISGLPAGVYVAGAAEPPRAAGDGSFFQIVDRTALTEGDLQLVFGKGILHDLELTVATVAREGEELETVAGSFVYEIEPKDSDFFALSHGETGFDRPTAADADGTAWVPLDIVINPEIREGASITIGGLSDGMILRNAHGETFSPTADGNGGWELTGLSATQVAALHISSAGGNTPALPASAAITVNIETTFEGEALSLSDEVTVEFPNVSVSGENNNVIGTLSGSRDAFDLVRQGNSISVNPKDGGESTVFSLIDFDLLRFDDGLVALSDYTQSVDVSAKLTELGAEAIETAVILVSNIPEGAILDLGVPLGNGIWGIPASEIAKGIVNLDFPTQAGAETEVSVSAAVMTEGEAELFGGLMRVAGSASAAVGASAGADARFAISSNGIRVSAGANVEVSAVASAGGTFGPYTVNVEVGALQSAEVTIGADFNSSSAEVEAYVGVRAEIAAEVEVQQETGIPGVRSTTSGGVGVAVYAEAGGEGGAQFGKGSYGAGGSGGAEYGVAATADGYHEQQMGDVTAGGGGAVSAGFTAGASGGGHAGVDGETVHFGFQGELKALVGVDLKVDIAIDMGGVIDAADAVGKGIIDATYAIEGGLMNATDAVNAGFIEAGDAIEGGLLDASDAVGDGLIDAGAAIEKGYLDAADAATAAIQGGFMTAREAVRDLGYLTAKQAVDAGLVTAEKAIGSLIGASDAIATGIISASDAVATGVLDATNVVVDGLATGAELVEAGVLEVGNAMTGGLVMAEDAIRAGFIDASSAIEGGFITASDAVRQGVMTGAEAVGGGFMSATDALRGGFMTIAESVNFQDISKTLSEYGGSVVNAVSQGLISAQDAVTNGLSTGLLLVQGGAVEAATAVADGLLNVNSAIRNGVMSAADAVQDNFLTIQQALDRRFFSNAAEAVAEGALTAFEAIDEGVLGTGTAIQAGLIDATEAINRGLVDAEDAFKKGWMSTEEEISNGFRHASGALTSVGNETLNGVKSGYNWFKNGLGL